MYFWHSTWHRTDLRDGTDDRQHQGYQSCQAVCDDVYANGVLCMPFCSLLSKFREVCVICRLGSARRENYPEVYLERRPWWAIVEIDHILQRFHFDGQIYLGEVRLTEEEMGRCFVNRHH